MSLSGGHGGDVRRLAEAAGVATERLIDFSASINPLGPPEWLRPHISAAISALAHYPDPHCAGLARAAAERYGVAEEELLIGNGSTELLYLLPEALSVKRALIPVPSYRDYAQAARRAGLEVETLALEERDGFELKIEKLESRLRGGELVIIGQPNNPTGRTADPAALRALALRHPETFFIIDEAFADFCDAKPQFAIRNPQLSAAGSAGEDARAPGEDRRPLESLTRERPANVAVLLSLTKNFAIPGLRLGVAVAEADVAQRVRERQLPWSVNTLAQAVGEAALRDGDYLARTRAFVRERRDALIEGLKKISGLRVFPGDANFLLIKIERAGLDAPELSRPLLRRGLAIRDCSNFDGLGAKYFRIAVRTAEENEKLLEALAQEIGEGAPALLRPRHTPAIMFQGTSSNAGKSILTAALCRILLQDGWRVAPFKAQNMSLNSFVTRDGKEMGRAQVVQAQAARLDPDVRMNPILLKPNSETGSQVVLMGEPVGNMGVMEYFRYKPRAFERVREAYDSLAAEHDAIVLEGAGSPAEVNLKRHDIVNMAMARHAGAAVLLVGDIDRGGVYASFVGSMEVFAEWERALVAGFVVNKFRGKASLLGDAHDYVLRHTGKPVLGVVHHLHNLGLPEEDSVGFKEGIYDGGRQAAGEGVEIAVLDLPHISNFTDIEPFLIEPDVRLRVVRSAEELGRPDAVILPGSKSVASDLAALRQRGLARRVEEMARGGEAEIVGICGGFQMLGGPIEDPHGIESAEGEAVRGLGLLPVSTVMAPRKTLTRLCAKHIESGLVVHGYEIHHGQSGSAGAAPVLEREGGEAAGARSADGRIWGSYLHGVFDADGFRRWFIDRLRVRKGLAPLGAVQARYDLEPAFERLADEVRASLEMKKIYELMGLR